MQIHLFSDGGDPFLAHVVEACREIISGVERPVIAYLPAASVDDTFFEPAKAALRPLGKVITMDIDNDTVEQMTEVLDQATVLFMPGGNTYLLNWRLNRTGMNTIIPERLQAGLPMVGVSAGSVVCGTSILTTNDMNCCATTCFDGLGLLPYNLNVHYPDVDGPARALRIERLWEVHHFSETPVIALEDSAWVVITEEGRRLTRGGAWRLEQGRNTPVKISEGETF